MRCALAMPQDCSVSIADALSTARPAKERRRQREDPEAARKRRRPRTTGLPQTAVAPRMPRIEGARGQPEEAADAMTNPTRSIARDRE